MSKIAYYDLLKIAQCDTARARSASSAELLHVHAADNPWPANDSAATHVVPSMRDAATRTRTMHQIWSLLGQLPELVYHGVDLREVTRYSLLFSIERAFHQAWVLSHLHSDFGGDVDWYTDSADTAMALRAFEGQDGLSLRIHAPGSASAALVLRRPLDALRVRGWMLQRRLEEFRWSRHSTASRDVDVPGRHPIVFAEFFPNSTRVSLSIARYLREHSHLNPVYVSKRLEALRVASAGGMPVRLLRSFRGRRSRTFSRRALRSSWHTLFQRLANAPIRLTPNGPDCRAFLLPVLEREALREFAGAVEIIEGAEAMLEVLQPAVLATTTWLSTFGRAMAATASQRGVPTAWIQHGLCFDEPEFVNVPFDSCLVWGQIDRRRLTQAGIPGSIHTIGAPHLDGFIQRIREATQHDDRPHDEGVINVLYLASRTGGVWVTTAASERMFTAAANVVLKNPRAVLTIKLHPGDHTGLAQRVAGKLDRVRVVQDGSSQDQILQCDVAIVTSSTTGLEVCTADKPLISLTPPGMRDGVDYAGYGAALCATNEQELEAALTQLLTRDGAEALRAGRRRLIDDMLDGAHGAAVKKGADVLAQMARGSESN
ncbi:MAG: hypothetical protein WD845_14285 [Pirellulales bacterium]